MENLNIVEYDLVDAIEKMQVIREKVHLGFANRIEIEELLAFENSLQETSVEFQSEFWA